VLGLITPSYQNAIMARSSKLPSSKDEELPVEQREHDPHKGNDERPNDEEDLESEVEHHSWPSHKVLAQIRFECWVCAAWLIRGWSCQDFGSRSPSFSPRHFFLIDTLPATNIEKPDGSNNEHSCKDSRNGNDEGPMLEIALPILLP